MQAAVGDRLRVHANVVGHPGRTGEIVEVRGAGGEPPYLVRFDDGHTAGVPRPGRDHRASASEGQEGVGEGLALDVFRANVEQCLPLLPAKLIHAFLSEPPAAAPHRACIGRSSSPSLALPRR